MSFQEQLSCFPQLLLFVVFSLFFSSFSSPPVFILFHYILFGRIWCVYFFSGKHVVRANFHDGNHIELLHTWNVPSMWR